MHSAAIPTSQRAKNLQQVGVGVRWKQRTDQSQLQLNVKPLLLDRANEMKSRTWKRHRGHRVSVFFVPLKVYRSWKNKQQKWQVERTKAERGSGCSGYPEGSPMGTNIRRTNITYRILQTTPPRGKLLKLFGQKSAPDKRLSLELSKSCLQSKYVGFCCTLQLSFVSFSFCLPFRFEINMFSFNVHMSIVKNIAVIEKHV